jgi:flagellar assembly protein FliH
MRWFDDSEDLHAASFRDVSRTGRVDLSWAGGSNGDVVSLRPPRVPAIGAVGHAFDTDRKDAEDDEVSGLHPAPPYPEEHETPMATHEEPLADAAPVVEPRRTDTMIDDIVPRAEEEAFVAIREAVARAEAVRDRQFAEAEERLVALALLVARRVIAREVSLDPGVVRGLVREGIAALGEQDRLVIRVGTFFAEMREELEQMLAGSKLKCEILVDATLGQSGCVVETDLGSVDESIDARLANIIDSLSSDGRRPKGK